MKYSTFLGSAVTVLLSFSAISYSRTFIPQQDPKPVTPAAPSSQPNAAVSTPETSSPTRETGVLGPATTVTTNAAPSLPNDKSAETFVVPAQIYTATAYSLRGRTASGRPVARGLIAADPRILPLGTRVRVEAGAWSGEYLVADTGGLVKGRRIDIWTASTREAMRFGKRPVKLTVLEFGGKRGKNASVRPRVVNSQVNPTPTSSTSETKASKQER